MYIYLADIQHDLLALITQAWNGIQVEQVFGPTFNLENHLTENFLSYNWKEPITTPGISSKRKSAINITYI